MTIATSATEELSIDRLALHAYRLAGIMPIEQGASGVQWTQRATVAREFLELICKALETEGRLVRARRFYTFQLTASTADYTMPASILDVYGPAIYIPAGQDETAADTENQVRQATLEEWHTAGGRSGTGIPTLYAVDRSGASVVLKLWQTPNEAGHLRVQANYLLANMTDGTATPDLERHWSLYLTYRLAMMLAEAHSMPRDKIMGLKMESDVLLQKSKGQSRERVPYRLPLRHRS